MDIIKSLTDNIDKVCKYIPFACILLCLSISSLVIYFCHIDSIYFVIAVYTGGLFIGTISKSLIAIAQEKYIHRQFENSKWLSKVWNRLSTEEQSTLVQMYRSDNASRLNTYSRSTLFLQNKGLIVPISHQVPAEELYFVLNPWTLKMIKENSNLAEQRGVNI